MKPPFISGPGLRGIRWSARNPIGTVIAAFALLSGCSWGPARPGWSLPEPSLAAPQACGYVRPWGRPHADRHALELVTRPGTRLTLWWNVFTNGVLDTAASTTRTNTYAYDPRGPTTTNLVELGVTHGFILGVPGELLIRITEPEEERSISVGHMGSGDLAEHGWMLTCGRRITLMKLLWDNGGGATIGVIGSDPDTVTRWGRVVLEAKAEALDGARGPHHHGREDAYDR